MPEDQEAQGRAGGIEPARAYELAGLVQYAEGAIVSRTIVDRKAVTITVFAFDSGQGLSEHTAPFDAYVFGLDGAAKLTIGGDPVDVGPGDVVLMPADVPHAVQPVERFKMLLVMARA